MNVSMMDAYNLGWKLHHCLRGYAKASLLSTYHRERYTTAKRLIEVDKTLVPLFSAKGQAGTMEAFGKVWKEFKLFTSGKTVLYESILCPPPTAEAEVLAKNIKVGSHLESYWVVNFASACAIQLCDRFVSDGRWRILLFAGDVTDSNQFGKLLTFSSYLDSNSGFVRQLTPNQHKINSLFDVITVISSKRTSSELNDFPEILRPRVGPHGGYAYDTIFADDVAYHQPAGQAYNGYGIDRKTGCIVVLRPDQYVAGLFHIDHPERIGSYFESFMNVPAS
ncbi:thioredoxin-like protein [Atractiella rhizophila]|nr:thioredoxin-like protein [Atractiella rhizophila]